MFNAQDCVNERMDSFELQAPRPHTIANVSIISVRVGTELVQEVSVRTHGFKIAFVDRGDFAGLQDA